MSEIDLISAAFVECQGKLKSASMDASNPFFKSRYATLGAVIEASRDALYGAGLAVQQISEIKDGMVTVKTVIRHKSGQFLDGGTMSLPLGDSERNSQAQLAGSLCTYLKRYSWASNLGIYSDEDDDGNSAPKGAVARQTQKPMSTHHPTNKSAPEAKLERPASTLATEKTRMWALNHLKAAPGQDARTLVTDYLKAQSWIPVDGEPEAWDLKHVPTTQTQLRELGAAIAEFEHEQRGPEEPFPGDKVTGRTSED